MQKIIALLLVCVFTLSCRKDLSAPGTQTLSDNLLSETITVSMATGSDSVIFEYAYDNNSRLSAMTSIIQTSTPPDNISYTTYTRDNSGRIVRIAQWYNQPQENITYDTGYTSVNYLSQGSGQLSYAIRITKPVGGAAVYDSLVFVYGASSRPGVTVDYTYPVPGPDSISSSRAVWTWDASSDLVELDQYGDSGITGNGQLNTTYQFSYDNKTNPLYFQDDILLPGYWYTCSPHNMTTQKNIFPGAGAFLNGTLNTAYQYGGNNRPDSAVLGGTLIDSTRTIYIYKQ
jgi:hypothetical protein